METTTVLAAGICEKNSNGGSFMYICESSTTLSKASYSNEHCAGIPHSSYDITSAYPLNNTELSNYTIICCSGNQCKYGKQTTYETPDCSSDITRSYSYIDINILGACYKKEQDTISAIQYTSCTNNALTSGSLSDDCLGSPFDLKTVSNGDCDQETGYKYEISCGIAMDTCKVSTSSPSSAQIVIPSPSSASSFSTPSQTTEWCEFFRFFSFRKI